MPDIKLLNIDCMVHMDSIPDKYYDLAIVDPPYGFGVNMNMGRRKGKVKKHEDKDWDSCVPDQLYFDEIFRISKNTLIWGGNYFSLPPNKCFVIWDKAETMYGRDFAEAEYCWASFNESSRIIKLNPNQVDRIHPTQKPIQLYKKLLSWYAKPNDKILDTHGGSIAIACHQMGFDLDLCEIDKDYYEAGLNRFAEAIKQQSLFEY